MTFDTDTTFNVLFRRFGGALFISAVQAGEVIGWAKSTTRNHLGRGTCPFPTVKVAGQRQVCLIDFAPWLDNLRGVASSAPAPGFVPPIAAIPIDPAFPIPRGRGRPPKVAKGGV